MRIVDAVRRALEEGDDSLYAVYVRGGCAIYMHETITRPDRADPEIMRRLARGEQSTRAGMTHVERQDGTLKPVLLIERRFNGGPVAGGRRITDTQMETVTI